MMRNMTDYIAVIGPGTAWREDESIKLSDLPDGGSHTVMVMEVVNSGINWAEPRDLTVEEVLEYMKTEKELHFWTKHPNVINVLFADGTVRSLPTDTPISLWEKMLAGEVKDIESIAYNPPSAPEEMDRYYLSCRLVVLSCTAIPSCDKKPAKVRCRNGILESSFK